MDADEDVGRPAVGRTVGDQRALGGERLDRLELFLNVFLGGGAAPATAGKEEQPECDQSPTPKHLSPVPASMVSDSFAARLSSLRS